MREAQLPEPLVEFLDSLQFYLGLFETGAKFVERADGEQTLWRYQVEGVLPETYIMMHQTQESMGSNKPRFRVRIGATISGEMGSLLQGMGSGVNRYTMLGTLILHSKPSLTMGAQFTLGDGDINTCAALAATAAAKSYESLTGSVRQAISGEQPQVVQLSRWSGIDFERLHYAFAHLGAARASDRELILHSIWGKISLTPVNNHPYWGGGLLVLVSPNKTNVDLDVPMLANEMNIYEWLASDIPMFGGWCPDEDQLRFVSFLPNFMKDVPQLLEHVVSWGIRRLRSVEGTVAAATDASWRTQGSE
jgi:hypothetical protein